MCLFSIRGPKLLDVSTANKEAYLYYNVLHAFLLLFLLIFRKSFEESNGVQKVRRDEDEDVKLMTSLIGVMTSSKAFFSTMSFN